MGRGLTTANLLEQLESIDGELRGRLHLAEPLAYRWLSGDSISFAEGAAWSRRVSTALRARYGIQPGDRVVVCTNNNADLLFLAFAVLRIGAVLVPLNFRLKRDELAYIIADCDARAVIVDPPVYARSFCGERLPGGGTWLAAGPAGDCPDGLESLDEATVEPPPRCVAVPVDPDAPAVVFYTSGTTGHPKGSMASSNNLLASARILAAITPLKADDFAIYALPFAHIMGFTVALMGICTNHLDGFWIGRFEAARVLAAMERHHATAFVGVPTMFAMLLEAHPERYDLSSMRIWTSGADAMNPEHVERLRDFGAFLRLGPLATRSAFIEGYGMVELGGTLSVKPMFPGLSFPDGCVGWPVPPWRVQIRGAEGEPLRRGSVGEVVVKGPGVTKGYLGDPDRTREAFTEDGWFRTGDLGRLDWLGRLHFAGRQKDVIKHGGFSVFAVEVEASLAHHPAVSEAVVFGLADPRKGEIPAALVTLREDASATAAELVDWAREHIAGYRYPRHIWVVEPTEIPRGPTGKPLKRVLRDTYRGEDT